MAETLHTKLVAIQSELKAPKNQKNNFGNYNYRSAEDILEALKPLLKKYGLLIGISDSIEAVGDRVYVKASVTVSDGENHIATVAFAREPYDKKGMDDSQITGATSSYARKYALNGMFAIDDTKDADSHDNRNYSPQHGNQNEGAGGLATPKQKNFILKLFKDVAPDDEFLNWYEKEYSKKASEMTVDEATKVIDRLKRGDV